MPELPEVETIKLGLQKYLVGHKVLDVEVNVPKIFQGNKKDVIGAKIVDIRRSGKVLIIDLNNKYSLAIHLKLTGQVIYSGKETGKISLSEKTGGTLPSNFTHVIFKLDNGAFLFYNDIRKFGWIKVIKTNEISSLPFLKEMGPEPFKDLTFPKFNKIIKSSNSPIKIVFMDQKKIGGIGNIYANEALFLAGIDPRKKTKTLSNEEIKKLYKSILEALKRGLKYGGSSDVNFVNALGENGAYQEHMLVYGRKGKECFRCKGAVEKIMLGGRGTYFCKECQK
ncbi:bifunctional DNA-formamidopyrimidine glycosylase/DNA-(apurinic or apyrimidinic site) lyase [Candidatus Microgenomates bacterium]|nr:MAG: bifunctional DNA-formamidopyrimidine glycosylase/DNA-(apurinic or apyrimidinic site) lyase [Candidatus Microgenomates bacterium]